MRHEALDRPVLLADYMIAEHCTVRDAAARFGISKSTVHKDVTDKLEKISPQLHREVKSLLDQNKAERHLRGGEATRKKYLEQNTKHDLKSF